jgi:transcriptional regulator with XRE-family HTH domain
MADSDFSKKIKNLRSAKGLSQEELAGLTGLSLRTIQRIENNETEPRGDSLKRLAIALNTTPDELINWRLEQDPNYLLMLSISALSFFIFPLLGIIIPQLLWTLKKDKIAGVDALGKAIINYQITWVLLLGVSVLLYLFIVFSGFEQIEISPLIFILFTAFVSLNILLISVMNIYRVRIRKDVFYKPAFMFLK